MGRMAEEGKGKITVSKVIIGKRSREKRIKKGK